MSPRYNRRNLRGEVVWEFDIYLGANDDVTVKVSNATGKVTEIDR